MGGILSTGSDFASPVTRHSTLDTRHSTLSFMSNLDVAVVGFDITPENHPKYGAWGIQVTTRERRSRFNAKSQRID